ncbi:hypothetical protein [Nocardioides ferulae]|uniref:hypothetical protein n=1 Tax=Nocardioides ferulae TaxID=2340821 RepID=UPI000EB08A44|nr:hypothetical protein [Nocardioides ferulae]
MNPNHLHQVATVLAATLGGAAFLQLSDGHLRTGLQLVALVVACFAVMLVNRRREPEAGSARDPFRE